MKTLIWAIVILIISVGILAETRYSIIVNPPIVSKLDRLTGDTWIANSGTWIKVKHAGPESVAAEGEKIKAESSKK
ncbi:MAG: hypothetical protein PHP46_03920 [Candidatus Omnitrophica bacterium]|nr:hypothetical protein [Candidatus Omnitrophota bacterium]